jgi:hydroxymethylbilane synthase
VTRPLRLGTRRSPLALAQATQVADALRTTGVAVEIVEIVSEGDRSDAPLTAIGGAGVFAGALRAALSAGEVDLAVHSLKDLPTAAAPGLTVAAVPPRADPRDALCARDGLDVAGLPVGATVGTGSPRRAAQLAALGLGLRVVDVRGNVGTRLGAVRDGRLDAVCLAYAGLQRLGRTDAVTEVLDPLQVLPAPGQGALAVECRSDDATVRELLSRIDDADTRSAVTAERTVLAALEAGCSAPVGALAEVSPGEDADDEGAAELYLRAVVAAPDGSSVLRLSATGPAADPAALGHRLARALLDAGANDLSATPSPGVPADLPASERGSTAWLPEEENVS